MRQTCKNLKISTTKFTHKTLKKSCKKTYFGRIKKRIFVHASCVDIEN